MKCLYLFGKIWKIARIFTGLRVEGVVPVVVVGVTKKIENKDDLEDLLRIHYKFE